MEIHWRALTRFIRHRPGRGGFEADDGSSRRGHCALGQAENADLAVGRGVRAGDGSRRKFGEGKLGRHLVLIAFASYQMRAVVEKHGPTLHTLDVTG